MSDVECFVHYPQSVHVKRWRRPQSTIHNSIVDYKEKEGACRECGGHYTAECTLLETPMGPRPDKEASTDDE